jgi:hypothetical protein
LFSGNTETHSNQNRTTVNFVFGDAYKK